MSSSKIMANSLDDSVFDGVAREESVQEVLSAVGSGVDTFVDKRNWKYETKTASMSTTAGTKTFTFSAGAKKYMR